MNLKTLVVLIALSLPLAGCGNKGPLVLPQKPVPVEESMPLEAPPEPADATGADAATDPAAPTADADATVDAEGDADADAPPPAEPPPTPLR